MSNAADANTRIADDGYQPYYAEKIWRLIPGFYRAEDDGTGSGPTPLSWIATTG